MHSSDINKINNLALFHEICTAAGQQATGAQARIRDWG
jgi:hypothetical protein